MINLGDVSCIIPVFNLPGEKKPRPLNYLKKKKKKQQQQQQQKYTMIWVNVNRWCSHALKSEYEVEASNYYLLPSSWLMKQD